MATLRMFISSDIEDKKIVRGIADLKKSLQLPWAKIKFVEDHNLHFTLKFFGDVEDDLLAKIEEKLSEISFTPFIIELKTVGYFTPDYPRVLWIGAEKGGEELRELSSLIDDKMSSLGFQREKREFSPHLTIGRIKYVKNRRAFSEKIDTYKNLSFGSFEASSFRLKKSTLTPEGPVYDLIKEFKLEGI